MGCKYLNFYFKYLFSLRLDFIKFMLSFSAHAMFLSGTRLAFRLPDGEYSTRLLFFPTFLSIFVNCTFIITPPSFKCRLTFDPINDLALLAQKLSMFTSPLLVQRFCSSIVDISVMFLLLVGCRVLYFHFCMHLSKGFYNVPLFFLKSCCCIFLLLRRMFKLLADAGEGLLKVKLYTYNS